MLTWEFNLCDLRFIVELSVLSMQKFYVEVELQIARLVAMNWTRIKKSKLGKVVDAALNK